MSTAHTPAPTVAELTELCRAAAYRHDPTRTIDDTIDPHFAIGYLLSALMSLTSADPSDEFARVHAARAIAVYVGTGPDSRYNGELAFSITTDACRRRIAALLEFVGR